MERTAVNWKNSLKMLFMSFSVVERNSLTVLCLGMTLKSLANSKNVVNTVNGCGHRCNHTILGFMETVATFVSSLPSDICPKGISR